MTHERRDGLSLRIPCSSCGQPVAADVPNRVPPGAATRCATCGAVQTRAARVPAATLASRGSTQTARPAWAFWLAAAAATTAIAVGGVAGYSRARDFLERLTFTREQVPASERGGERREGVLRWRAKSTGGSVAAGRGCEIAASVLTDALKVLDVQMTIVCDGRVLYRGGRATGLACDLHESPGDGFGSWEYDLACAEPPGSSTPRLALETRLRRAAVRDEGSGEPVPLEILREDGRRAARPLFAASLGFFRWRPERSFVARVVRASDDAPVGTDAECIARVYPVPLDDYPCRTIITCGDNVLYGGFGQGFTNCVLAKTGPTLLTDDTPTNADGDPILHMDLAHLAATVSDAHPTWSVELALRPKP